MNSFELFEPYIVSLSCLPHSTAPHAATADGPGAVDAAGAAGVAEAPLSLVPIHIHTIPITTSSPFVSAASYL